jgi:complex I intermediate-associated protein 30 (CIA30)
MTTLCSRRGVSGFFFLLASLLAAGAALAAGAGPLAPMIADFEAGRLETTAGLALAPITDEQFGGTSEAKMTIVRPGAHGSHAALHVSFLMGNDFQRPFSGVWALLGAEGLATDLSAYRGIRFYARSQSPGGAFLAGVGQFSAGASTLYMSPFEVKPEWTLVELPFDKLDRFFPPGKGPAFAPKDIVSIGISAAPRLRGRFDLEIDQLELYK